MRCAAFAWREASRVRELFAGEETEVARGCYESGYAADTGADSNGAAATFGKTISECGGGASCLSCAICARGRIVLGIAGAGTMRDSGKERPRRNARLCCGSVRAFRKGGFQHRVRRGHREERGEIHLPDEEDAAPSN